MTNKFRLTYPKNIRFCLVDGWLFLRTIQIQLSFPSRMNFTKEVILIGSYHEILLRSGSLKVGSQIVAF